MIWDTDYTDGMSRMNTDTSEVFIRVRFFWSTRMTRIRRVVITGMGAVTAVRLDVR